VVPADENKPIRKHLKIYIKVFYFLHKQNEDFWGEGKFLDKNVFFSLTLELAGKMEKE